MENLICNYNNEIEEQCSSCKIGKLFKNIANEVALDVKFILKCFNKNQLH